MLGIVTVQRTLLMLAMVKRRGRGGIPLDREQEPRRLV